MPALKQNFIHAIIIAIVIAICLMLTPIPKDLAHGILLPKVDTTQIFPKTRATEIKVLLPTNNGQLADIPNGQLANVKNSSAFQLPSNYVKIGTIRVSSHFNSINQTAINAGEQKNIEKAKLIAAKSGADAIVINTLGRTGTEGPLDGIVLYATAIHF